LTSGNDDDESRSKVIGGGRSWPSCNKNI